MGRPATGVRGITLRTGDEVVAMTEVRPGGALMTVCENGYGKRTELAEYRVQSRGGVGIISIQSSERNGKVVGVEHVRGEDELMLVTKQGKILRMLTWSIRAIGRATQGVRLIEMEEDDRVVSIARLADHERDENQAGEPGGNEG
jgi:DNA gyrase subunit A